jgi:hypothetical protein
VSVEVAGMRNEGVRFAGELASHDLV